MREYRDFYFKKAKRENFPARSVYKLQEIDAACHVLQKGAKVLDLGAAPGSWSLAAAQKIGPKGCVVACDLQEAGIAFPANVFFRRNDIFNLSEDFTGLLESHGPFDLVMSDMAPATTGSRVTDQARSLELACRALEIARERLRPGGNFVVKIFMGPDTDELLLPMRQLFEKARIFKPKSSRAESREIFYLGLKFKKPDGLTLRDK